MTKSASTWRVAIFLALILFSALAVALFNPMGKAAAHAGDYVYYAVLGNCVQFDGGPWECEIVGWIREFIPHDHGPTA